MSRKKKRSKYYMDRKKDLKKWPGMVKKIRANVHVHNKPYFLPGSHVWVHIAEWNGKKKRIYRGIYIPYYSALLDREFFDTSVMEDFGDLAMRQAVPNLNLEIIVDNIIHDKYGPFLTTLSETGHEQRIPILRAAHNKQKPEVWLHT